MSTGLYVTLDERALHEHCAAQIRAYWLARGYDVPVKVVLLGKLSGQKEATWTVDMSAFVGGMPRAEYRVAA